MTGKNIMKFFWAGFVVGALTLSGWYMLEITSSPYNTPFPKYQRLWLHSLFDPNFYSGTPDSSQLYQISRPKDHPITKTIFYKLQLYIGEDDILQLITAEDLLKEKATLEDHRGIYAVRSGMVERIDRSGYRYGVTIAPEHSEAGHLQYTEMIKMSPLKVGDRIEAGYYLGKVDMSRAELDTALEKINSKHNNGGFGYKVSHHETN